MAKKNFMTNLNPELIEELKIEAKKQNRSTNNLIETILKNYLDESN